jgi:hypothetical protein
MRRAWLQRMGITMAIANLRRIRNRTKSNVSQNAKQVVRYCTYERGTEQERGTWYSREGPQEYEQVKAWAMQQARDHTYLYSLVLSVREGVELGPDDFAAVMGADGQFEDWWLISHADTLNRHAHVLCFADKTLGRAELIAWQQATCARLAGLEQQRELERQAQPLAVERGFERGEGLEL